jgi:hypothetical protein
MDPMQTMLLQILFGKWLGLAKEGKIDELIEDLGKALATLEEDD